MSPLGLLVYPIMPAPASCAPGDLMTPSVGIEAPAWNPDYSARSVEALEMVKEGQTQTGLPKSWCSVH